MKSPLHRAALVVLSAAIASGCAKKIEMRMAVDVLSQPEKAQVKIGRKTVGETPRSVNIKTFEELESISAASPEGEIVEKRIRILSPDKAELIFRFGKEPSPLAKKLGAAKLLVFEYSEKVSFDVGKSDLKPEATPILAKQKEILKTYFPNAKAFVCGYTDSTGGTELNLKLSLDRAQAVYGYLAAADGVSATRLEARGFGEDFPQEDNATSEGRAANRRTEVVLPQ